MVLSYEVYDRLALWNYVPELYHRIRLQNGITESYYGMISLSYVIELNRGIHDESPEPPGTSGDPARAWDPSGMALGPPSMDNKNGHTSTN